MTTSPTTLPPTRLPSCGDLSCEFLVDPIARPAPDPFDVPMPKRRRVVLLDHRKPNSHTILSRAGELLRQAGVDVPDVIEKAGAGTPMSPAILDSLSNEEGLVFCGVSDCGSCSASSSVDSVMLNARGIAGVAVLTEPFREQVDRAMAYQRTDRAIPLALLPHPMQNITADKIEDRARMLADRALELLADLPA
ncbi:UGSC family (seleno)protein [Microbacterium sp. NPDC055357]